MKTLTHRVLGLSMTLLCALHGPAQAETILKVHHFLPSSSNAQQNIIEPWCAKIEKESAGELKCQIYPAMQLGGTPSQLLDQVRDGVADLVWAVPSYTAGRYVKSEVFELPFMAVNAKQGSQALWEFTQRFALDEYKGVKPIFMHTTEGYVLHSRKKITQMEQMRGLKIRTTSRRSSQMVAQLGGTPVQMPMSQVADALSKGVVDAVLVPWEAMPATKLYEIVSYHLDAPKGSRRFVNGIFMFGMNQAKYNGLPANLKQVIDANSGPSVSAWAGDHGFDRMVDPLSKLARDRGNTITLITDAELVRWENASTGVSEAWIKEVAGKGADGKQLITEAKQLLDKYSER